MGAQINVLNQDDAIRDNDLRALTQRFEQTSAELNAKFQDSHTWHAEVTKICRKSNEWCSQLEELTQRLQAQIGEHNIKLDQHSELIEAGVKSQLQDLSATFAVQIKDLTSRLDAETADRKQKQEEQKQAEISRRTLTSTLAEEISSIMKTESALRVQVAQFSDHESTERHRQLENLESRVKAQIDTCADIIQEHKAQLEAVTNTCWSNTARIEELACSQTRSHNQTESLWDQPKPCQNVLEPDEGEGGERSKVLTSVRDLLVASSDRQSKEMVQSLKLVVGMHNLKQASEKTLWMSKQSEKIGARVATAKKAFKQGSVTCFPSSAGTTASSVDTTARTSFVDTTD